MRQDIIVKVNDIKDYIDTNICSINNIEKIAQIFNINKNVLHEHFKLLFGYSCKEYIIKKKFESLIELIKTSENDNIVFYYANSIGFSSSPALCNLIKRKTGFTFQEFKQKVLDNKIINLG